MKISIAIPTYESHGLGWLYISELLNSIQKQTYKNVEVVISDQSNDDKTKRLVEFYSTEMEIVYLDSTHLPRRIGSNLNNAIQHCTGEIVKPMCADDFFVDPTALQKIAEAMQSNPGEWLVTGCVHAQNIHSLYGRMIPHYHDKIHLGANTISSPSVLAMRSKEYFDEKLSLLIDCEMYKRLYTKHGLPLIIEDPLICNRMHENQMQNLDSHLMEPERAYCIQKYGE
jgi:glycosyltransferase involved in cell wall biosynthesis